MNSSLVVDASAVDAAYARIHTHIKPTPLVRSKAVVDRAVYLKLETAQPTGSFKVRGALSNLLSRRQDSAGFVTASAGNHGLGLAWAMTTSGRSERVTIFIPRSTPETKVKKLRKFDVDLRIVGETYDDALAAAYAFERSEGATLIHAYDDVLTSAGQGTVAIEIARELDPIGTVVVPVGGGGLIAGTAAWLKTRRPATRVVAVQPDASPALSESVRLGRALLEFAAGPTLADGLSGGIGRIAYENRHLIDEIVNVPEAAIRNAVRSLYLGDGIRAEASAATARAVLDLKVSVNWPTPIVCVLTGGNIDDAAFDPIVA